MDAGPPSRRKLFPDDEGHPWGSSCSSGEPRSPTCDEASDSACFFLMGASSTSNIATRTGHSTIISIAELGTLSHLLDVITKSRHRNFLSTPRARNS